jgi:alpha-1,3-rhamnosyltransferase
MSRINKKIEEASTPLVSIIVPIYNHENYLRDCISSIANQEYERLQVILVDDGSTDKSFDVAKELENTYKKKFESFTLLKNHKNIGLIATLNNSISLAKGEYISFLASDDMLTPNSIELRLSMLDKLSDSSICAIFGESIKIPVNQTITISSLYKLFKPRIKLYRFEDILMNRAYLSAPTMLARAQDIKSAFPIKNIEFIEDRHIQLSMTIKGKKILYTNREFAFYRIHSNNTSSIKNIDKLNVHNLKLIEKFSRTEQEKRKAIIRDKIGYNISLAGAYPFLFTIKKIIPLIKNDFSILFEKKLYHLIAKAIH